MDIQSISSAYEGIKFAKEAFESIIDAKADAKAKLKVTDALNKLGSAQDVLFSIREELFRLQSENAELNKKIKEQDSWESRTKQYTLSKTDGGAIAYKYSEDPMHFACPNCFERKEIQILQDRNVMSGTFDCPGCGKTFHIKPPTSMRPSSGNNPYT